MAVDRTEDPETEEQRTPNRPPPDRPGAADQPSRADSRKAAAEADDRTSGPGEARSDAAEENYSENDDASESAKAGLTKRKSGRDLADAEAQDAEEPEVVTDDPRSRPPAGPETPERPRPETNDAGSRPRNSTETAGEKASNESSDDVPFWTSSRQETIGTASLTDGTDRPDAAAERPVYPEVTDRSDYAFTEREYAFAGISPEQAWHMDEQRAPLGIEPEQWDACVAELRDALAADGINDADIRLKGSAARFCSENPKKWFPQSDEDLRARVGDHYRNAPADERTQRMENAATTYRQAGFAEDRGKPAAPFFDSMYRLDATNELSDYDFQVASDGLADRFQRLEKEDPATGWRSEHGGHYKHRHLERVAPALHDWAGRWEGVLGREVTIATFDHRGPSTGLHDSDWKVIEPEERTDP